MRSYVEIDGGASRRPGVPRARSNSYNFVPLCDFPRASGAACPLAALPKIPLDRARTLLFRMRDRMRVYNTETTDFDAQELHSIKEELGQVYVDVSSKLAPDDFARDLKKLSLIGECERCPRRPECPGAWEPVREDVFTRDDARVRAILAELDGRVLDVGGGEATYLAPLAERAERGLIDYTCVDPDPTRLALLAARYPFAHWIQGLAEDLDPSLGLFDHVLFLRSVNHLHDPERAIERAAHLLKPGGTLLLVDNVAFGLVRSRGHAVRAEAAPQNLLEHHQNHGAEETAGIVATIASTQSLPLDLLERRDIGPRTSNQWLLRYARVADGAAEA